jgi:Dehydrogenases with different specificities (related to short-chain alcohol dehydrogenases)
MQEPRSGRDLAPGAALVSGGTGSLGRAICERLADAGAPVLIGYHSRRPAAEAIVSSISARGGRAKSIALDLTSDKSIAAAFTAAEKLAGGLGTLVYASGAQPHFDYLSKVPSAEWRRVLEIELFGLLALTRASLPLLRQSKGAVVTIATYQAQRLEAKGGLSTIPKAAAERVMAVLAREEARHGVRANTVRAGWIEGGFGASMLAENGDERRILGKIPMGRLGRPREIADAVAFLASLQAGFTTGAVLTVDGGQSL